MPAKLKEELKLFKVGTLNKSDKFETKEYDRSTIFEI